MNSSSSQRVGKASLQVLCEDGERVLCRGWHDFGDSDRKAVLAVLSCLEQATPDFVERLAHEYALKDELDGRSVARPLAVVREHGRTMLLLEDPGGEPLDRLLGQPLEMGRFLRLAIGISAALRQLHERRLIHKDIKPSNLLVECATGQVWLTGLGIASRLPREHQSPEPPELIAGTLAYMAPEQTGRMNRSIDSRSDLYSLGVTLYEMLTGVLPFIGSDPMEWVHCHIARQPVPPEERSKDVPVTVSAILLKLLAKTAEERYQTAAGVESDLRRCLAQWERERRIEAFTPGQHDTSDRLLIPEKLYGRAHEVDTLVAAFDRVVAHGTTELVLVSGYSGIGKSSVVNELHKVLVSPRGLFAAGKFDQYKRDVPYATLAQAFQSLVRPLLGHSEAALSRWRDALQEALGPSGALIVNLVPELELIIGKQPPVADLSPQETRARFQTVFRRFLAVFARPEHPLALFLDDLQWLDAATLDLLEHLATHPDVRHLLLVGAYRDNEVGPSHPLIRTQVAIREASGTIREIVLAPLALEEIGRLVADTLRCEQARAQPLAQLLREKTGGNPFFAIQFISALADDGLIAFDPVSAAWTWDLTRIFAKGFTDNVVDFMVGKLNRLPNKTRDALKLLACLGNIAETTTLAMIRGESEEPIDSHVWDAVHAGLIFYLEGKYAFLHDRVREAAYSLVPADQRAALHLWIGRRLLGAMSIEELTEHIFDVVNQFNRGAALISDPGEMERAAALNLRAGRKAKMSSAYASACRYFSTGTDLLGPSAWATQYDLAFSLALERAESTFLSSQFDQAEVLITELLRRAVSIVDKAAVYRLKMDLHVVKSENPKAVDSALECLRLFGIDMAAHPNRDEVQAEQEKIWQNLGDRPIESLIDLQMSAAPEPHAAMRVLAGLIAPAFFTDTNLFNLEVCRMVNLSLTHGLTDAGPQGYGWFGWVLCYEFRRYDDGYSFGKLAIDLVEKRGFTVDAPKVHYAMGLIVPWVKPLATSVDFFRTAFRSGVETGDVIFAVFSANQVIMRLIFAGAALDEVWRESEKFMDFAGKLGFPDGADRIVSLQRFVAAMRGKTASLSTFSDAAFDEAVFEAGLTVDRMTTMICWYWIVKIGARFLSGDYGEALESIEAARPLLWSAIGDLHLVDYHFYSALTLASLDATIRSRQQSEWRARLASHCEQLHEWAAISSENFGSAATLVDAEIAWIEGRALDAERLYETAIRLAREQDFIHKEALANELAARFYAARGFETIALAYLRNARYCYRRWGAFGKVRQLEQLHPKLLEDATSRPPAATVATFVEQLDIGAVVKASQAVSGEIVLDRLIETLMTLALEHAGAERGLLILLQGDTLQIEAEARTGDKMIEVTHRQEKVTPAALPEAVLHTVIRTQHSVILDDASAQNPFAADAYVSQTHARSVLCLPLVKQAKPIGVLYLENNLASHVFTPARISVLELLASQAAISLENAGLYGELQVSEDRWRSLFENVPVGVALTGSHGRYVTANQAFQKMTGYSEAELRHLSPVDITHEDDRTATEASIAACAAGSLSTQHVEKRYRRKDGGVIWVDLSAFLVPIVEGAPLFAGVAVDVTDRKRTEEELRRSEASLTQAQQISRTGSWRWNVGTGEVRWSAEHFYIFDYDSATTQPSYAIFMERIHAEDRPSLKHALDRAQRERSQFQHEYRIVLPNGSVKHLQSVGLPGLTDSGDLEFFGTVMDITERKRAEEALRHMQMELAHANRVATMGQLTASIAHEVKQPIGATVTNAQAALRFLGAQVLDLNLLRDILRDVVKDGNRAGEILNRIRDLTKKAPPRKESLNIDRTIRDVIELTRGEAVKNGVSVQTDLAQGLPRIEGDRVQLQQVILNLIMNAFEAMSGFGEGTRELLISTQKAEPDGVLVEVRDSGPGLAPATLERVFDAFYSTKSGGLGMGLSICRSIIEAHGGRLWASANVPRGATFEFTLPTHPEIPS
jgi:PAS domain S-box-containing protein